MIIRDAALEWRYQRSGQDSDSVPVSLRVLEKGKLKVELQVEKWNAEEGYAEKVRIQTQEGFLKWSWRTRALEK